MERIILLLRGVNVGGANKLPMAQLRALLSGLGYADVATYLQSGNAVVGATRSADAVAAEVEQALATELGLSVRVIARTRDELAAVVAANPLRAVATEAKRLHVFFLAEAIDPADLAAIDRAAYAPDRLELRGRELYLWTPDGFGTSRLAQALTPRRLGVDATARNWRTVEALLALADAPEARAARTGGTATA